MSFSRMRRSRVAWRRTDDEGSGGTVAEDEDEGEAASAAASAAMAVAEVAAAAAAAVAAAVAEAAEAARKATACQGTTALPQAILTLL